MDMGGAMAGGGAGLGILYSGWNLMELWQELYKDTGMNVGAKPSEAASESPSEAPNGVPTGEDIAGEANDAVGNDGFQGSPVPEDVIDDAGDIFFDGETGFKWEAGGRSSETVGNRRLRKGPKAGKNGIFEANFEIFDSSGRLLSNYHIQYIPR
jgi:hypothetical protein